MSRQALDTLSPNINAEIVAVDVLCLQLALLNVGVRIGDTVQLSNTAPLGDPLAITVNGTKVAVRKRDAACIQVRVL